MTAKTENRTNGRHAGFSLVELMVSLLIVGIVMMGWWRIMNATSPYREAQRRAAVEIAAGMLDVFPSKTADEAYSFPKRYKVNINSDGNVIVNSDGNIFSADSSSERQRFPTEWFPAESPVRYTLQLVQGGGVDEWTKWSEEWASVVPLSRTVWLVVELFDGEDANSRRFTMLKQIVSASP